MIFFRQKIQSFLALLPLLGASFFLTHCALNFSHYTLNNAEISKPFFDKITLDYAGKTFALDSNLHNAYNNAVDTLSYPLKSCSGNAKIFSIITQNTDQSPWYVTTAFLPFSPAMPINETWTFIMNVQIYCGGILAYKGNFIESENVSAFFYGKLRTDLANKTIEELHRKLINRIDFETHLKRNADLNSAKDF